MKSKSPAERPQNTLFGTNRRKEPVETVMERFGLEGGMEFTFRNPFKPKSWQRMAAVMPERY